MHNHEPSAAKVAADKIVTKIKKRAVETQESTCQVINECTQNTDVACQGAPNQQALKKLIRRKRNEINQAPSNPTILSLSDNLPNYVQPIFDWFEDNYVGRMNRRGNGRRQPLFPHEMWNVYNRTLNQQDRTNNHAEAAHRRLQTELGMDHPTTWKLIDGLRKVQANRDFYYEHLVAGHNLPVKLKKYRDADQRILTVVRDYNNRSTVEYLRGIAYNYQMNL